MIGGVNGIAAFVSVVKGGAFFVRERAQLPLFALCEHAALPSVIVAREVRTAG